MRAREIVVFPVFGRALTASVADYAAYARLLHGDVAIRGFRTGARALSSSEESGASSQRGREARRQAASGVAANGLAGTAELKIGRRIGFT